MNELLDWIDQELYKHDWNTSELARRAGLSQSAVSMVRSGQRGVSADFCIAIAKAFGERPEKVLRIAGILPPTGGKADDLTGEEAELVKVYRGLSQMGRQYALDMVHGLREAEDRKKKNAL